MGIFGKPFGNNNDQDDEPVEHAVIVYFSYGRTDLSELFALEEKLEKAIADAGAGEFDGNEVATDGSDGTLYMYGPDANALFAAVRSALEACPFMKGARAKLRFGPLEDGVKEIEVEIGT